MLNSTLYPVRALRIHPPKTSPKKGQTTPLRNDPLLHLLSTTSPLRPHSETMYQASQLLCKQTSCLGKPKESRRQETLKWQFDQCRFLTYLLYTSRRVTSEEDAAALQHVREVIRPPSVNATAHLGPSRPIPRSLRTKTFFSTHNSCLISLWGTHWRKLGGFFFFLFFTDVCTKQRQHPGQFKNRNAWFALEACMHVGMYGGTHIHTHTYIHTHQIIIIIKKNPLRLVLNVPVLQHWVAGAKGIFQYVVRSHKSVSNNYTDNSKITPTKTW